MSQQYGPLAPVPGVMLITSVDASARYIRVKNVSPNDIYVKAGPQAPVSSTVPTSYTDHMQPWLEDNVQIETPPGQFDGTIYLLAVSPFASASPSAASPINAISLTTYSIIDGAPPPPVAVPRPAVTSLNRVVSLWPTPVYREHTTIASPISHHDMFPSIFTAALLPSAARLGTWGIEVYIDYLDVISNGGAAGGAGDTFLEIQFVQKDAGAADVQIDKLLWVGLSAGLVSTGGVIKDYHLQRPRGFPVVTAATAVTGTIRYVYISGSNAATLYTDIGADVDYWNNAGIDYIGGGNGGRSNLINQVGQTGQSGLGLVW